MNFYNVNIKISITILLNIALIVAQIFIDNSSVVNVPVCPPLTAYSDRLKEDTPVYLQH